MDADEPRKRKSFEIGQVLDALSVDELEDIVAGLGEEIGRLRAEIEKKKADIDAAQSLFKS